jgi:hypothetical protein
MSISGNGHAFNRSYTSQTPFSSSNMPNYANDLSQTIVNEGWTQGSYSFNIKIYTIYSDSSRDLLEEINETFAF